MKVLVVNMREMRGQLGGWMHLPKTGLYTIESIIDEKPVIILKYEADQV